MAGLVPAFKFEFTATSGPSPVLSVISTTSDGMTSQNWQLPIGRDHKGRLVMCWQATGWEDLNHRRDAGGTGIGVLNLLAVLFAKANQSANAMYIVGPQSPALDLRGAEFRVTLRPEGFRLPRLGELCFWFQTLDRRANLGQGANVNYVQLDNTISEQLGFPEPYQRGAAGAVLTLDDPVECRVPLTIDNDAWEPLGARATRVAMPDLPIGADYGISKRVEHALRRWTTNMGVVFFWPGEGPIPTSEQISGRLDFYGFELWVDPALNGQIALPAAA